MLYYDMCVYIYIYTHTMCKLYIYIYVYMICHIILYYLLSCNVIWLCEWARAPSAGESGGASRQRASCSQPPMHLVSYSIV